MSPYLPGLVKVFANNSVEDIGTDPEIIKKAFGEPAESLLQRKDGFPEVRQQVERLKRIIERMEGDKEFDKANAKVQVSRSLRAIFRFVRFENAAPETLGDRMNILKDLILERYSRNGKWSKKQCDHFTFVFERLKEWNTFFLSYTNDGGPVVNKRFKDVVDFYTEPEVLSKRDRDRHNILADTIVTRLRKRLGARGGFFDKTEIVVGMNLDQTIQPAATKTFAFVQLVQLETFDSTRDENWSWKEYMLFDTFNETELKGREDYREAFSTRFSPVLTASKADLQRQLQDVSWDYDLWYQRIFSTRFVELPMATASFDQAMDDLRDGIVNSTYAIIDKVPD